MMRKPLLSFALLQFTMPLLAQRPAQYPPAWHQFSVEQFGDYRRVCGSRLGAGPSRPAEVAVLEVMPRARSMRILYHRALTTEMTWWQSYSVCSGRFWVTLNDRFISTSMTEQYAGTNGHAIAIYDLLRGSHVALRADQFLPLDYLERRGGDLDGSYGSGYLLDPRLDWLYITDADQARQDGVPYLSLDLPALEVRAVAAPSVEMERERESQLVNVRGYGPLWWHWSAGSGSEPDWNKPMQLPLYLEAATPKADAPVEPLGIDSNVLYFKWDATSATYVRCPAVEWIPIADPDSEPVKK
jgi:hypothetical protein